MKKLGRSPLGCYIQNIKALGLPLSVKKNSEISLFCSYARTCEPHSRTSPDPRGIVWTNLVEVLKETLHTKYQGSRPSSFRVEELWNFPSLFLCWTCEPKGGASFDPRGILWTNLVEVHTEMPHSKYPISTQSSFREKKIEDGLLCSYVPTCGPRKAGPVLTPVANLVEVLKEMLYTNLWVTTHLAYPYKVWQKFGTWPCYVRK